MNNCNTENTPRGIIMTVVWHEKYIKYFNAIVILERIYCVQGDFSIDFFLLLGMVQ